MTHSKNSMQMQKNFRQMKVSFIDTDNGGSTSSLFDSDAEEVEKEVDTPKTTVKYSGAKEDKNDTFDTLVFSANELLKKDSDILTEGQYYLGISMLVYMYSHLRETCRMGHTRCKMYDIDVNSLQSQYASGGGGDTVKYLGKTKTAGSIIRSVIDELDYTDENEEENDIIGNESKEYEKR